MRRFTLGTTTDRKIVVIDLNGTHLSVVQMMPDGTTKRKEQELSSEAAARSAADQLASQLISKGYIEQVAGGSKAARSAAAASQPATAKSKQAASAWADEDDDGSPLYNLADDDTAAAAPAPVLSRLPAAPEKATATEVKPKKKKKSGGKKKKKGQSADGLDKRVLAGVGAVGVLLLAGLGLHGLRHLSETTNHRRHLEGFEHRLRDRRTHRPHRIRTDPRRQETRIDVLQGVSSTGTYSIEGQPPQTQPQGRRRRGSRARVQDRRWAESLLT